MSKLSAGFLIVLITAGLVSAVMQSREQHRLREELAFSQATVHRLSPLPAENNRLSNSLAQARVAQADAAIKLQELFRLRKEFNYLQEAFGQSNQVHQAELEAKDHELSRLKEEVQRLNLENEELATLRSEIQELQATAAAAATPASARGMTNEPAEMEPQALSIRMIETSGPAFAEKLKRSSGASDSESFPEVFARFLQMNGVAIDYVTAAAYDQRTGRVILRGVDRALDRVEQITRALDQSP